MSEEHKKQEAIKFYKKVFYEFDNDVNGYLSDREFKKFLIFSDIEMDERTFQEIYERCNHPDRGKLQGKFLFDDFISFCKEHDQKLKIDEINRISIKESDEIDSALFQESSKALFEEIDTDQSGTISFRELMVFCKKRGIKLGFMEIVAFIKFYDQDGDGEIDFEEVTRMNERSEERTLAAGMAFVPDAPDLCLALSSFGPIEKKPEKEKTAVKSRADVRKSLMSLLKPRFENALNSDDVENMRWALFAGFERQVNDETIMTGKNNIVQDVLPGRYNLQELVSFDDLPELKPRHIEVQNVAWVNGRNKKTGTIYFPDDFDGKLDVEFATNELLDYYGCSIANSRKDDTVVIDERHAIQDFNYGENYLEKYVLAPKALNGNSGAGMERHGFHHVDMPLNVDNGFFILAKFVDDQESTLHITAFKIPVRHCLYIPANVIHSNDYLKGTWRTMLSDAAPIDYVHLSKNEEKFNFEFNKF